MAVMAEDHDYEPERRLARAATQDDGQANKDLAGQQKTKTQSRLALPQTKSIKRHLETEGDETTFLDVALAVLERIREVLEGELRDEANFVRDVLLIGTEASKKPCASCRSARRLVSRPAGSLGCQAMSEEDVREANADSTDSARMSILRLHMSDDIEASSPGRRSTVSVSSRSSKSLGDKEDDNSPDRASSPSMSVAPRASLRRAMGASLKWMLGLSSMGNPAPSSSSLGRICSSNSHCDRRSRQSTVHRKNQAYRGGLAAATTELMYEQTHKDEKLEKQLHRDVGVPRQNSDCGTKSESSLIKSGAALSGTGSESEEKADADALEVTEHSDGQAVFVHGVPWLGPPIPSLPTTNINTKDAERAMAILTQEFEIWDFDLFRFDVDTGTGRTLQLVAWEALRRAGAFSHFQIEPAKCGRLLEAMEGKYLTSQYTSYHNNLHGADVVQTIWSMLFRWDLRRIFDPLDQTSLILAAMCHDVGHDGRNNMFHVNAQDELAVMYNDRSVLENFHCATAFRLFMHDESANFMMDFPRDQFKLFRVQIVDMILCTDMSLHFSKLTTFQGFARKYGEDVDLWNEDETAMFSLRGMVLHTGDISNPAKQITLAHAWAVRILLESFAQGDVELRRGLPISPLCDRSIDVSKSQIGFIDFIVYPCFELLATTLLRAHHEKECLEALKRNKEMWSRLEITAEELEARQVTKVSLSELELQAEELLQEEEALSTVDRILVNPALPAIAVSPLREIARGCG
eukprot:TRINITY_DN14354_c0_g2_i1.p1 TRINITY_DN14354_c0_g2~~TRINITY_DN14354_c0_g2_i1.p1  ORF type:complete len:748 (-),score=170.25 TRINITY_DN14354_c0_g2_i1:30-2273(-)